MIRAWHVEFDTGLTQVVQADNYYSAGILASEMAGLSTFNIVAVSVWRGGD